MDEPRRCNLSFYYNEIDAYNVCFIGTTCYVCKGLTVVGIDCVTKAQKHKFDLHANVRSIHYLSSSTRDKMLFVGCPSGAVVYIDVETGKMEKIYAHSGKIAAIVAAEPGVIITSATDDKIKVWNLETGLCLNTFTANIMPHGLVYSSKYSTLFYVDTSPENLFTVVKSLNRLTNHIDVFCNHLLFISRIKLVDDDTIVIGAHSREWGMKNIPHGTYIPMHPKCNEVVLGVAVAPDQHHVVSLSDDNLLRVWGKSGTHVQTVEHFEFSMGAGLAISGDGKFVASTSLSSDKLIYQLVVFEVCPAFAPIVIHGAIGVVDASPYSQETVMDEYGCIRRRQTAPQKPEVLWTVAPTDIVVFSDVHSACIYLSRENAPPVASGTKRKASETRDLYLNVNLAASPSKHDWFDAIRAVRNQLSLPSSDRAVKSHQLVDRYKFDTLQMVNQMSEGKGLLSGKTVPVDVFRLIAFYVLM